ncbi:MAG: aminopeptidase [Euryarchaeota archaeon]|nr:aminopeptidase [Euryarchaeota archaeon]MBT7938405.1 aminopeptidase [Euryarchaeota archaeon]
MGRRKKGEKESSPESDDPDEEAVLGVLEDEPEDSKLEKLELKIQEMSEDERTSRMGKAAKMVVKTCMDIRRGENVLIVCDPTTTDIGQALYEAASKISDRTLLIIMPKGRHHGEEPPGPVANLMRQQQVVMAPTRFSLTHTKARFHASRNGARIATMPGMNAKLFTEGGMTSDFGKIRDLISELGSTLRRKKEVKITSKSGTDVSFEVDWRKWNREDSGICNRPQMVTNLPAGKIFTIPRQGSMNGKVVIDGSCDADILSEPLTLFIENGIVVDVKGGQNAANIRQSFGEVAKKLRPKEQDLLWTVAEFGFGVNPNARLIGNLLEDEKVLGTCYFSIGDSVSLPGSAQGMRITGVLAEPTLEVGKLKFIEAGEFLLGDE